MSREQYITEYSGRAVDEMKRTGIPASITLAQALHESENGNSILATLANNHFGIKCTGDWKGMSYNKDDDSKNECFRKYNNSYESYFDHSEFLKRDRYAKLFILDRTDYKAWAKGLKEAGYATNPKYPEILIKIIEENQLYRFDQSTVTANELINYAIKKSDKITTQDPKTFTISISKREVLNRNGIDYIIAREGDTFEKITREFDMWKWQLPKYNDMPANSPLEKGQIIYLQPKHRNPENGVKYHFFKEGETLWQISQLYGIKLKRLYSINNLKDDSLLQAGQKLRLGN